MKEQMQRKEKVKDKCVFREEGVGAVGWFHLREMLSGRFQSSYRDEELKNFKKEILIILLNAVITYKLCSL